MLFLEAFEAYIQGYCLHLWEVLQMVINQGKKKVSKYNFNIVILMYIAALFFVTYEAIKRLLGASADGSPQSPFVFMAAATCGEIVSKTLCQIKIMQN